MSQPSGASPHPPPELLAGGPGLVRGCVWVVEDSALEAERVRRALEVEHDVRVFADAPALLEALSQSTSPPDVVVLDWYLPHVSGLEACRTLRSLHDETALPVLVLTASGDAADLADALAAGANDFVPKPYEDTQLLARVRTQVRVRAQAAALRLQAEAMAEREALARTALAEARAHRAQSEAARRELEATQAVLRASEQRYRTLFESVDEGFCTIQVLFDAEGRPRDHLHLEVNPAFYRHTGLPPAVGRTVRELTPDIEPFWLEFYGRVARTGEAGHMEDHSDALGRTFDISAFRVGAPEEHRVAVFFRDITERRRAQARLEAERRKLHDIFDQAPAVIAILEGPELVFTFANPAYVRLVEREVVGKPLAEALPDLAGRDFRGLLERVMATGEPFVGRAVPYTLARHAAGEQGYIDFVYQPLRDDVGRVQGVLMCGYEVTELVQAQQQAEALAAQLRGRADFERQLIGVVSHDLRNPLSVVLVSAQALLRRDGLDVRQETALRRMRGAAERMERMVRDLLDFTQVRVGGGLAVFRAPVDVHALARQAVEELQYTQPHRALRVVAHGDGAASLDADRVVQLLGNLLANALAYGAEDVPVDVTTRGAGDAVELTVHNAGAPIPPAKLERLFQPLERGDVQQRASATRSIGLGLFIVDGIVRAHGGSIRVESTAEHGTTFTVRLPRAG